MSPFITLIIYALLSVGICFLMALQTNKRLKNAESLDIEIEGNTPYRFGWITCVALAGVAGLSAWCGYRVGNSGMSWIAMIEISVSYLVVLGAAVIDFKTRTIPNYLPASLFIVRVVMFIFELIYIDDVMGYLISSVLGCLLCTVGLTIANKISKGGIGGGDIKLLSAVGFMCGVYAVCSAMMLALFACIIVACFLLASKKFTRKDSVPFGPFIWVGFLIMCLMKMY